MLNGFSDTSNELKDRAPTEEAPAPAREREAYEPPRLERAGDLRTDVLGPSPGFGDSPTNRTP